MSALRHWTLSALVAVAVQAPALATTPLYGVTNLGNLFPTGVNDSGWVSGYDGRALLWRPGIGLTDLGSFGVPGGGVSNRATAVNNAGQVAGYTWSVAANAYRAFLWQVGSGLTDLGALWGVVGVGKDSYARDVNNHGQVALQLPRAAGSSAAALWQPGIGFT